MSLKKVSLNINCPQCKKKMLADYDMSDHSLDGSCGECGHKVHSYSPKIAQKIQAKIHERKRAAGDRPGVPELVPENPSGAIHDTVGGEKQNTDINSATPETLQLVPEASLDAPIDTDDGGGKLDMFVLILNIVAIAIVAAYMFTFTLDGIINWVVISIPVIALWYVWRSDGRVRLFNIGNNTLNTTLFAMLFPIVAFAFMPSRTMHVLDYAKFWLPFICVLLIIGGVFYYIGLRNEKVRNIERVLAVVCAVICAYGIVTFANIRFDSSGEITMDVPVLAEYQEHHYNIHDFSGNSYYITIPPIKNNGGRVDVAVSEKFYDYIKPGLKVTVVQKHGFLKIPWYRVKSDDVAHPI